jgi:hypothetical protein
MLSARETPVPQLMVRVRGSAASTPVKLRAGSGDERVERQLLISDREHDEFLDFKQLGQVIRVDLLSNDDDQPADNSAWLVREASWPRVEARMSLPAYLQRMVEVYARQRPAMESSERVVIVSSIADLPPSEPGVVVAPATAPNDSSSPAATELADHPIASPMTRPPAAQFLAADQPPADWKPVLKVGGKAWVAVREQPMRAVWIGFEMSEWARSTDFVVFWANVLNWAGTGEERFASYPVGSLEGNWTAVELAGSIAPPESLFWPGLYRRGDGTLRALHAPDVPFPLPAQHNWRAQLARLGSDSSGRRSLAPAMSVLALSCLALSAWGWKRQNRIASVKPE